ncbi:hypothetical protein GCM10010193_70430 [Kitasatospora atroaurantiaca]|uniref:Uncharacterized protein n=1 Tax=Kitasatospora atroaurantiaca TaxID=285545 RepID=A0A561ENC8_9ACTN|nr:hypothetical protein [Kitasatospora atroaurantiaca]TWE17128.1 hypothetical protein FB465_2133 [Kitasatospora atroaurantiaca]
MPISRAKTADIRDRRTRLIRMRIAGIPFKEIADDPAFDYKGSVGNAKKDFTRAMRETAAEEKEAADTYRQLMLERLDHYLAALSDRIDAGEPRAIEVALQVETQRAKVTGAYEPERIEATVTTVSPVDVELREMVNEAKARVAAEEAALRGGA